MGFFKPEYHPCPTEDLLTWAFDHCNYDKDKPVLHSLEDPSRSLSCRQARSMIRKLIAGFRKAGLKKGECVSVTAFNDILYAMVFNGIVGAGGVFAGTNPGYKPFEIIHHFRTSEAKILIVEPELLGPVVTAAKEAGVAPDMIFIFDVLGQKVPEGFRSWTWLLEHGEDDWIRFDDLETAKNTTIARLYTSGTSGLPKAAMVSHYNATSFYTLTREVRPTPFESRNIFPLPMFHVSTVPGVHASPWRSGQTAFIQRRFDLAAFLKGIEQHQINELGMVPPLVLAIVMSPLSRKYSLKSVKKVGAGAAPMDASLQNRFKALCAPDAVFTQVLGMTESTGAYTLFYYPEDDDTGSIGKFIPNIEHKLIDDNGNDISGYDVQGEMCVKGPTIISGYYNNPKADAESFDGDGWFKTGDICYCDGKTKLWYIVDRKKELIKVRGFQVAPPELEGVLLSHPAIVDAAVIGVRFSLDSSESEYPRAYVVRRPGSSNILTEDDVKRHVSERLARYKELAGGVVFVEEIPKSPSGKILKRVLRERADEEIQAVKARL